MRNSRGFNIRTEKHVGKNKVSGLRVSNLLTLTLKELLDIKRASQSYEELLDRANRYNAETEVFNADVDRRNAKSRDIKATKVNELRNRISHVGKQLDDASIGLVQSMFKKTITHRRWRVEPTQRNQELIKQDCLLSEAIQEASNSYPTEKKRHYQRLPSPFTEMKLGGAMVRVSYARVNVEVVDQAIERQRIEKEKSEAKVFSLRARAAANEDETRSLARSPKLRSGFQRQIQLFERCPYCNEEMRSENAHLDHIYPVAKGGKSTSENCVFVCSSCNIRKGKLTLNKFVSMYDLSVGDIHERLEVLGKDY